MFLSSPKTEAWTRYLYGYESPTMTVMTQNMNSYNYNALIGAASSWNATPTRAVVMVREQSSNIVYQVDSYTSWYGLYSPYDKSKWFSKEI
ncbi:hypothetical protein AB3M96_08030 [Fredinandcohnia sp. 179-A 10B2 NHS]